MNNRAYCIIEFKALDPSSSDGPRRFTGIATTPTTDRMGDIVEPKGAEFNLPIPLLWQHDSREPIGWVTAAHVTDKGIRIEGEVTRVDEPGRLKDRLDEAWQSLRAKLVRGLSIGFQPLESSRIGDTYTYRYLKWLWLELSAVTIPANGDCTITAIKAVDTRMRAASGRVHTDGRPAPDPGVSGTQPKPAAGGLSSSRTAKDHTVKTLTELNELRTTKAARMQELLQLAETESRDNTDAEAQEFDTLCEEVKTLDGDIRRARLDQINVAAARPVEGRSAASGSASRARGGPAIIINRDPDEAYKGQKFTRMVIAKCMAHLAMTSPSTIAQARWGKTDPRLVEVIKANEVAGGGSGSGEWGAELVAADNRYTGDFIEFLHGMTVFDRLPLRPVPANITIKGQDGAATGYWVGESKPIPASAQSMSAVSLTPLKVAALAVVSNELLRDSSPAAEMLVRDALAEASSQRVDQTFLSTTAASAGVSPAGLLNGVTIGGSSGTDADALRSDIAGLMNLFIAQKNVTGLTFVTTPALALQIQLMRNALGQREFPGVMMTGGELEGVPMVTGDNVGAGDLILLKPSDIWKIADSGIEVSVSRDAVIEQSSAPIGATDTPTAMTQAYTSMFQAESTAIKVVRSINFAKRRSTAVAYIGDADYGAATSI